MDRARIETGELIYAKDYSPEKHGQNICCPDNNCKASMSHKQETLTHGGQFTRKAHFATLKDEEHPATCSEYKSYLRYGEAFESLKEALDEEKSILLNLNMKDLLFNLTTKFNSGAFKSSTSYMSSHKYKTLPVKNVKDILAFKDKIEEYSNGKGLQHTYINYINRKPILIEDFLIKRDKVELLFKTLYSAHTGARPSQDLLKKHQSSELKHHLAIGTPRLFVFQPTEASKNEADNKSLHVNGSAQFISKSKNSELIMLQSLYVVDDALRQDLRTGGDQYIMALPYIDMDESKKALDEYKNGKKEKVFLKIKWRITSKDQYTLTNDLRMSSPRLRSPLPKIKNSVKPNH